MSTIQDGDVTITYVQRFQTLKDDMWIDLKRIDVEFVFLCFVKTEDVKHWMEVKSLLPSDDLLGIINRDGFFCSGISLRLPADYPEHPDGSMANIELDVKDAENHDVMSGAVHIRIRGHPLQIGRNVPDGR